MVPLTPQKPVSFSWIVMVIPPVELEAVEALDEELDELVELVEPVVEELELELLELEEATPEDELELLELELELDEELDELLLEGPPSPVQVGAMKLPS
jgi:hypothetical protein